MGFNSEADVEIVGVNRGPRGKAILFQPDFMDEEIFIPASQCDFVPDPDSDEEGRGTMFVRAWLARKEGWAKNG